MALVRDFSKAQIAFQITGGSVDQFQVMRYSGTEGLCQLYRFEIEVATTETSVPFDDIVGKPAVLSINTDFGGKWFHGIVSRFEMIGGVPDQALYRIELVPQVWLLTHRYNSRIFQEKTTKEIIATVLKDAGVSEDRFDNSKVTGIYTSRPYCVQYRETDYNFIGRLMEEEGIRWYFDHTKESHVFVMTDEIGSYAAIAGESAELPYQPPSGMNVQDEHVFRFRLGQGVRPGAVVIRDFNFENPPLKLESLGNAGRDAGLEFSDYPGEFDSQDLGGKIAEVRAQEFETGRTTGTGMSNSPRLAIGRTFDLIEHIASLNGTYLLTSLTHRGKQSVVRTSTGANGQASMLDGRLHQAVLQAQRSDDTAIKNLAEALLQIQSRFRAGDASAHRGLTQWVYHLGQVARDLPSAASASGANPLEALLIPNQLDDTKKDSIVDFDAPPYECRFECIPSSVKYRPPRICPWPIVRGSQTARVVGKKGEEIDTDEYGRVKVQFNWDREGKFDDKSSCWIRVNQGMAGGGYGIMFIPRIGQEVIVDFLEGNPDQPIITGRVYNADHMPPYKLPDEKTKSVIKTHTSKGGGGTNELRFEDLKGKEQILINAEKDFHIRVANDRVENVDNDRHLTVKKNKFELIKKAKNVDVKTDLNECIGGKKSLKVGGDVAEEFDGKHSEETKGDIFLKSKSGKIVLEAAKEITLKVGGNFIKIDAKGLTEVGTKILLNSGGSAGSGSAAKLTKPKKTVDADSVKPGQDVTYSGSGELVKSEIGADIEGHEFDGSETEQERSWVEIELVDELGDPVPHEPYKITMSNGDTRRGALGADGRSHISLDKAEEVQVCFTRLDVEAWMRDAGPVPPASADAGGSSPPPERSSGSQEQFASSIDEDEEEEALQMSTPEDEEEESIQMSRPDTQQSQSSGPLKPRKNPYKKE